MGFGGYPRGQPPYLMPKGQGTRAWRQSGRRREGAESADPQDLHDVVPKGREPYGHGASVVVRGRESRLHGHRGVKEAQRLREAGFLCKGRKGKRNAHSRIVPEHYPRPR